ncbi:putative abc transporter, partial [Operophtera brumata]
TSFITSNYRLKYIIITCILVGAVNLTDVSFYEILGVTKQASALDIRQAYKKLTLTRDTSMIYTGPTRHIHANTTTSHKQNNYLDEGFYFINFYSPFCPPCQNVADHWKKLAEMYKGVVKIGAVNCKYYNSFCYNSMRISSYPTLIFYP